MADRNFIAIPKADIKDGFGESLGGDDLKFYRREADKFAAGAGYGLIEDYTSWNDLIVKIRMALGTADQLRKLEINAHGSPTKCNGLYETIGHANETLQPFGDQFSTLPLSDIVDVYLSGCNTGLRYLAADPRSALPSVAEQLAKDVRQFSAVAPAFDHKIKVFGARGYLKGTNLGTEVLKVKPTAKIEVASTSVTLEGTSMAAPFVGSAIGSGVSAWNEFHNGW